MALNRNSDGLAEVARAAKLQVNIAMATPTPTHDLVARMTAYLEAAENGPEFDYEAFALDRSSGCDALRYPANAR